MVRKAIFYITTVTIIAFMISGFKATEKNETYKWFTTEPNTRVLHLAPEEDQILQFNIKFPFVGKTFVAFKQALAFKESRGKFSAVNTLGYMGKYQFGKTTLSTVGVKDSKQFMKSPAMQEKAFKALLARNKWYLRKEIKKYSGTVINDVLITESGILAAAHLSGVGGVRRYLKSNGKSSYSDKYGTTIHSYLKKFSGCDTTLIMANPEAKVII